jgi:hypothetical protein
MDAKSTTTTTTQTGTTPKAPRPTHELKLGMMPHLQYAFETACLEMGVELKGPSDQETRHAIKALFRACAEIAAEQGWGWSYAVTAAAAGVHNVFSYHTKAKKPQAETPLPASGPCTLGADLDDAETEEDEGDGDPDDDAG